MARFPPVGSEAPDFQSVDARAERVHLAALRGRQVVLVFRRYLGCSLCRADLARLSERHGEFLARDARVIAVVDSGPVEVERYLRRHAVPFHLVGDSAHTLYRLYGVGRGSLLGLLNPGVVMSAAAALLRQGHGWPGPSELQLPADFVIDPAGRIGFAHVGRNVADSTPVDRLLDHCHARSG